MLYLGRLFLYRSLTPGFASLEFILVSETDMKTYTHPLSMNPLITKHDLSKSLLDLLKPLENRYVPGGLLLGAWGTNYSPRTALLEGWSRLLWGLVPLLAGGGDYPALQQHLEILKESTDPKNPAYWGHPNDIDQRLVEMAAIGLALLMAPQFFWDPLKEEEKKLVYRWLSAIEECTLPAGNWYFFRILVCEAFRALGLPVNEEAEKKALDTVDSYYQGDGWYSDGPQGNYDLYNPLGFHFYNLLYTKLVGNKDPERAEGYAQRAKSFASQYLNYFREDGSMVPYGRSLSYRFGAVSFFSACAFADLEVLPWGVLKGILLRQLRWWFRQPILDAAGLLSVGYGYPNLVMAEQYNSPASPYWGLKVYLVLALAEDHPFWQAKEEPLPTLPKSFALKVPKYVLSHSEEDVQLFSPGRYPSWEAVQAAAKYCKFVYSARFGFSVSHGAYPLEKTGCDSSLVLSEGDGYWRERRQAQDQTCGPNWTYSRWYPWPDVEIETLLITLGIWHVRIHRVNSPRQLLTIEGGFSIPRYQGFEIEKAHESILTENSAILAYPWAASRIIALEQDSLRQGDIINLEPNLNILHPSVEFPVLRGELQPGNTLLICAVRAGDREATLEENTPTLHIYRDGSMTVLDSYGDMGVSIPAHSIIPV